MFNKLALQAGFPAEFLVDPRDEFLKESAPATPLPTPVIPQSPEAGSAPAPVEDPTPGGSEEALTQDPEAEAKKLEAIRKTRAL